MLELQHTNLVGPTVKFSTIINYHRAIEKSETLGVALLRQEGYITRQINDKSP